MTMLQSEARKNKAEPHKSAKKGKKPARGDKGGEENKPPRLSVAQVLVQLFFKLNAKLFHAGETGYAVIPIDSKRPEGGRAVFQLGSSQFKAWLRRTYMLATDEKRIAGSEAVSDAIRTLEGLALYDYPAAEVHLRVAEKDDKLYLDLGDERWRAVEIDARGWRVVADLPVYFRRQNGLKPLPEPKKGGSLDRLRDYLNVASDAEFRLAVAWLLAAFRPRGPYPLMVLSGQQGSAKSTTARVLRALIDPNAAPIRCEPKEARDLMIAANGSWVLALDNLSSIPPWLSDALCRLSTGGGFATRQLYTDSEEVIFDAQRPVILTSIEDVATRGDLLERAIVLALLSLPEDKRCPEQEFWDRFSADYPLLLGALLDAVSGAMRELPGVKLSQLPRMADFAVWATACERALGWPAGSFLAAYDANRGDANSLSLESSPLSGPIFQLLANSTEWTGTAGELLQALAGLAGEKATKSREWPGRPNVLGGKLKRLAPNLSAAGIEVEFRRDERTRTIVLRNRQPVSGHDASLTTADEGMTQAANRKKPENKAYDSNDDSDGKSPQPSALGIGTTAMPCRKGKGPGECDCGDCEMERYRRNP